MTPAKTDKSLEIASIPTSIHFALSLKFIVSHCFTHKNLPPAIFYLRSLYFTSTYIGPCTVFFKTLFFQPYTDSHFKKSLFYNASVLGCQFFIPERGRCIQTEFRWEKSVSITRLLLLPSREPYLPSRWPREPYRHIPAIKINATSLMEYFFCKSLYMREPMRGYTYSVNH